MGMFKELTWVCFKELTWVCFKELTWVCFKELTWVCLTYYVLMLKKQSMRHIFFIDAEKTIYFHTLFQYFTKTSLIYRMSVKSVRCVI